MNVKIGNEVNKSNSWFLPKIRSEYFVLFSLVFISALIHIYLSKAIVGAKGDQDIFLIWMKGLQQYGLGGAYVNKLEIPINYPPLFMIILYIYGLVLNWINFIPHSGGLVVKFPMMVMDILSTITLYFITKKLNSKKHMVTVALFALSPTILFESAIWGQVDILHGMFLLMAILLFFEFPMVAGVLIALALLSKFQAIVILPVVGAIVLRQIFMQRDYRSIARLLIGFAIPVVMTIVLFVLTGGLHEMMQKAYVSAIGSAPIVNMNAMNLWFYFLGVTPDASDKMMIVPGLTLRTFGFILLTIATLLIMTYIFLSKKVNTMTLLKACAMISFSFFMLPTEIHDRYNFPTLLFVMATLLFDKTWAKYIVFLTVTTFFNLVTVIQRLHIVINPISDMWIVYLNVIMFFMMFWDMYKEIINDLEYR